MRARQEEGLTWRRDDKAFRSLTFEIIDYLNLRKKVVEICVDNIIVKWQCQTKSSLGNLVCFKTCNLDLRNSLK